ncbi:hypothetical protein D3C86_1652360 [compost metagenome]
MDPASRVRHACRPSRTAKSGTCGGRSIKDPTPSRMPGFRMSRCNDSRNPTVKVIGRRMPRSPSDAATSSRMSCPQTISSCGRHFNWFIHSLQRMSHAIDARISSEKIGDPDSAVRAAFRNIASMNMDAGMHALARACQRCIAAM